jgi:hypothetical protein
MTNGAAAAAAAMIQAVKASGAIVRVEPRDFNLLLDKCERPLVVQAKQPWPLNRHQYLFGFKGLVFYTRSKEPLHFSMAVELVSAKRIWIPS